MSKLNSLLEMFRLPKQEVGTADWSNIDLFGSRHDAHFCWSGDDGFEIKASVDQSPSFSVKFTIVAGSLRVKEHTGLPEGMSGSRLIANHLASFFMQGDPPRSCSSIFRPVP